MLKCKRKEEKIGLKKLPILCFYSRLNILRKYKESDVIFFFRFSVKRQKLQKNAPKDEKILESLKTFKRLENSHGRCHIASSNFLV